MPKIKNKILRYMVWGAASFLVLTGCSSQREQQGVDAGSVSAAAVTTEDESAQNPENTPEIAAAWESALPEDLPEDEVVLSRNSEQRDISFRGEKPDLDVTFGDHDLYWVCLQDSEAEETALLAEVTDAENASSSVAWLDAGNDENLKDPNTVIHGNGSDGGVFAALTRYGDEEFFRNNPYIYVYTTDSVKEYQVFAAYTAPSEDILVAYNCYNVDEFSKYVEGIFEQRSMGAVLDMQLQQTVLDAWCILTLDADLGNGQSFLVQAVPTSLY